MLDVHEPVHQFPLMVVIAQGDGARHLVVAQPLLFDKVFTDKVAYGLGAVPVVAALYMTVKFVNKAFFERDAETVECAHRNNPFDCMGRRVDGLTR